MPCYRCERVQTDPVKGPSLWKRGVLQGEQILICPECQAEDPGWQAALDACPNCGSKKLTLVMGSLVCRNCTYSG